MELLVGERKMTEKNTDFLRELAVEVFEKTLKYEPEDLIVGLVHEDKRQVRFARNEVTIVKRWNEMSAQIFFVTKEKQVVATSIEELQDKNRLEKAIEDLVTFAKTMKPSDNYFGIAKGPFSYPTVERIHDPKIVDLVEESVEILGQALETARNAGARDSAGVLKFGETRVYMLSNHDVEAHGRRTNFEFSIRSFVSPIESGHDVAVGCMFSEKDIITASERAGSLAKMSEGARKGDPGTYHALLSPIVAADIIAANVRAANPFAIETGFSWLKDKLGEQVGPDFLTAHDDGLRPNGLNSSPFDLEGVPRQKTTIIEKGVLKSLIHNTSTAVKANTKSTGNAGLITPDNSNIVFEPGSKTLDELIASCDEPTLYVTSNWYTRFTSYAEGVFSTIPRDGIFYIEKGEIKKPLRELRIAGKMLDLFNNIIELGNDLKQIYWWEVEIPTFIPTVLVKDVQFTSGTK